MFERVKAYKKLKKSDEFLKGVVELAKLTNDEEMLRLANDTLYRNSLLRRILWRNRNIAIHYNSECMKAGF